MPWSGIDAVRKSTTAITGFRCTNNCGNLDGACDQLWEETYKCRKVEEVRCRCKLLPEHIDGVTQGLESVKTDANRQNDPERGYFKVYQERKMSR